MEQQSLQMVTSNYAKRSSSQLQSQDTKVDSK